MNDDRTISSDDSACAGLESQTHDASGMSQTDWSMVIAAGGDDTAEAEEALGLLVRRYWPAIYAYFRYSGPRGRDVHEAADLTQGFVCDVILGRKLLHYADPKRGRFRALLLTAVENYVRDRHRYETAGRRSVDGIKPLNLDPELLATIRGGRDQRPENAFSYQWSATLVRQVLARVQNECERDELSGHWTIFEARIVRPMLTGESPVSYARLVERLNLVDASQAANMMVTVKRRFATALYEEVGKTVNDPSETEGELLALLRDLERTR
jgi:RNA polymerase sigma-70 factor (ECF subfamily)